jgi:hypothetical protein
MAQAAEHAFNTPFFTGSVLVTPKLFTTYRAMNDLSFSKDVQVKVLDILAHTKMYTPLSSSVAYSVVFLLVLQRGGFRCSMVVLRPANFYIMK